MIDELELLSRQRPAVPPPSDSARAAALTRLNRAITGKDAPRRRLRVPAPLRLGWLAPAAALAATLLIAGGAILLLHRAPVRSGAHSSAGLGSIVASNGAVLVGTRPVTIIRVEPDPLLSGSARAAETRLLARLIGVTGRLVPCARVSGRLNRLTEVEWVVECAHGNPRRITLPISVWDRSRAAVAANQARLPGVTMRRGFIRINPRGALAPQVVSGVESEYASSLKAGDTVKLSLDASLQRAGDRALSKAIAENRPASGGAFVAMNPENGQVLAMGSAPDTRLPAIHINSAIQGAGPTGTLLTPLTALAALESGEWNLSDTYDDTGQFCFPATTDCLRNSGHAAYGDVNLVSALRVSDDIFFYNLGARMNVDSAQGGPLQTWARDFGIGRFTGVDLPGDRSGTLPTPAWQANRNKLEIECENATGPFKGQQRHPAADGGCGIAVSPTETWNVGDNVNLAVGQGDVQITPLQVAVAYSALANGGNIVTPRVGSDIQTAGGTVLQRIDPPIRRHLNINPIYLRAILEGLREAASQSGGTSADVFSRFPEQVYGKTGTAQYISRGVEQDYAWYAGFVPATATSKPIVVVVWVQQGGFGATAAAPVARQILSQWFFGKPGPYVAGTSTTL
jgi:Penicillin binding protein transpeptidase domain